MLNKYTLKIFGSQVAIVFLVYLLIGITNSYIKEVLDTTSDGMILLVSILYSLGLFVLIAGVMFITEFIFKQIDSNVE